MLSKNSNRAANIFTKFVHVVRIALYNVAVGFTLAIVIGWSISTDKNKFFEAISNRDLYLYAMLAVFLCTILSLAIFASDLYSRCKAIKKIKSHIEQKSPQTQNDTEHSPTLAKKKIQSGGMFYAVTAIDIIFFLGATAMVGILEVKMKVFQSIIDKKDKFIDASYNEAYAAFFIAASILALLLIGSVVFGLLVKIPALCSKDLSSENLASSISESGMKILEEQTVNPSNRLDSGNAEGQAAQLKQGVS